MKVCVIQPKYSMDSADLDARFETILSLMDECDESMDLIVLPEYSDCPVYERSEGEFRAFTARCHERLMDKAAKLARRTNAVVFAAGADETETGIRNTVFAFDRNGNLAGKYVKRHPTHVETDVLGVDDSYSRTFVPPTVITVDGVRYGFLTCYDFYFYEAYSQIARQDVDVIIGCSQQRSDPHEWSEVFCRFLAINTSAYVVRASISMDESSAVGGGSMIVDTFGNVLLHMKSRVGIGCAEFDPHEKFKKPAGFGNPPARHFEYVEKGRRPWLYRPAGSAIVPDDDSMPYPRICAHRGYNMIAPTGSMPALGAAIALGADEIEFDLRVSKDGELVVCHDSKVLFPDGVKRRIEDLTFDEILKFDAGAGENGNMKDLRLCRFEDVLSKFSCHAIMNVHVKADDEDAEYDDRDMEKIVRLMYDYGCQKHAYFMGGMNVMRSARRIAPEITRCMGAGREPWKIVDQAIEYECRKVQLFKPYFNEEMVKKAHENGIICNVFFADDVDEARRYREMGIETILTNDCFTILKAERNGAR